MKKISGLRMAVMGVLAAVLLAGCSTLSGGQGQKQAALHTAGNRRICHAEENKGERIYTDWFFQ